VLTIPTADGTISAQQVEALCREHVTSHIGEHMVQPGMVYISFPTEFGTLYSKAQLAALHDVCKAYGLPLFLDGARLGYGLMSPKNDLTLADIAQLCDVFYIGGTKCGALFGEAVVILNEALKKDFRYAVKQHGGMLAKGRLLGIQFATLFTNDLYFSICGQAVDLALSIRKAFEEKGVALWGGSFTNQQFPILTKGQMDYLRERGYIYEVWGPVEDGKTIVRFCTSWATQPENVARLLKDIAAMQSI
ncbi:MAG: low specificity L-threonine aldolase, partial [Clostridia bacterium]|nr:low specificity L-threonine aldolase [Clostridia bacterium]